MNLIEQLENFIKTTKSERELKRALAAKMAIQKKYYQDICQLLQVSQSFQDLHMTKKIWTSPIAFVSASNDRNGVFWP